MAADPPTPNLANLMAHLEWLRRLALCLAADRDDADDLVQETWMAATRSPPDGRRSPRPWLAEVMRNLRRMAARRASRRKSREQAVAAEVGMGGAATDVLLERLELQRTIAALVYGLEEPYRTTVLLRFFEGRTARDIAEVQGIPAGTVRWRLNEALRRLRKRLDSQHGGQRAGWAAILAPVAPRRGAPSSSGSAGTTTLAVALPAATLVLAAGFLWLAVRESAPPVVHPRVPDVPGLTTAAREAASDRVFLEAADPQIRADHPPNTTEESTMSSNAKKAATLMGLVLPALAVSAGEANQPLGREDAIAACVSFKEKVLVCKEELADHFAAMAPVERRAAIRAKALEEIVREGSGPLEPRQAKCAKDVDRKKKGKPPFGLFSTGDLSALEACDKQEDCKARIACGMKAMAAAMKRAEGR